MINTAVILAGRLERYFEEPIALAKCLDGESMLDRLFRLLEKRGFSNIVLVVGYKSELFDVYKDRCQLVENKAYVDTSSMSSLFLASPYIASDFLLIESDTLFEEVILDKLLSATGKNIFLVASESGTGDEAFVEVEDGFVHKVSKDLHALSHVDGEMIGLSKLSYATYQKMLEKWTICDNPMMNYEYLLLDVCKMHEVSALWCDNLVWLEVDDQSSFVRLKESVFPILCRKENPFDKRNVLATFCEVLHNSNLTEQEVDVAQIGGMTNRNFKITHAGNSYVLRVPGNGTEGMVVRKNEDYNTRLASQMGITPELLYLNIDTGIKLTKYIDGAETLNGTTIQRLGNLKQVIGNIHKLHYSGVRLNNDFNVFKEILVYEDLLLKAKGKMYEGYEIIRPKVFALADNLNVLGVMLAPCHNDLVAENFVKRSDGRIFLIDWEYSGMNDPLWDLAALFVECDFTEENRERALKLYFGQESISSSTYAKLKIYQVLMDVLWAIWTRLKEAQGDDFGSYGMMRYQRAIECLNQLATLL